MYENKPNDSDYIEYYMLNTWWGQDWITSAFCCMCGITFNPDTTGNVYKLKKQHYNLFFCEPCFNQHKKRNGVKKWDKIELYWDSLISKPELK